MYILSSLLLCINILLMIIFYRKILQNFSQDAYSNRIRDEVNKLIIDIEHESNNAITILESKMTQIEKLISEVDKHIILVEQEHKKRIYQNQFNENYQLQKMQNQEKDRISSQKEKHYHIFENTENTDTLKEFYQREIEPYKKLIQANMQETLGLSQREYVIELARQGFSLDFIAEKVSLPLGEIALILSINE